MATVSVDTSYIAASYSIPEPTLETLLVNPSPEEVQDLLSKIEEKARDYEALRAEKLRSDVELETAVQSNNRRTKQHREALDKAHREVEELRKKLSSEETARASLESELQNFKSSTSSSSSEVQALNSRISSLEASNRDAISLLEAKSTAHDKLADELSAQQQKAVAQRREFAELEEKQQAAENASMSAKFREQSLQQEVELLKKNNEWHEKELKHRGSEHTKYRKEKSAQIGELQRSLEDVTQANETLRSTETTLRNRLDEVTRRLEDAYVQIQTKDEDATKREDSFRAELENATRLAELQRKSAETARSRQQDLEQAMDQLRDEAATEIGNLQADINVERSDKEAAERRVAELEAVKQELEGELATIQNTTPRPSTPRPSTPRRSTNGVGAHNTPGRNGSPGPISTPGGSRFKGTLTMTQLYSEYSKVKSDLDKEKARTRQLQAEIAEYLQSLEGIAPQFEELKRENESFKQEVEGLGNFLEQASKERESAKKAARMAEGNFNGLKVEMDLLRQQLRDLSTQVKILLVEVQAREQGLESMSAEEQAQLEQAARGELDENSTGMTATGRFISQRLVIFRNVRELQKQNEDLLTLTRKLGEEMEGEEARAKSDQQQVDKAELESLRDRISEYQDSIHRLTTQSESYIRERDMFRRIIAHRHNIPANTDLAAVFGQSVDGSIVLGTPSRAQSVEPSADARALAEHIKLVKEMQQHFDSYREETYTNHQSLKQQVDQLSKQKSDLQSENARYSSQLTQVREQLSMARSNYDMAQGENRELQKRNQVISENAAKQDARTQHVAEELVETKGLVDSMRHENANLKAEKELWKRIDERRTQEYDSVTAERNRLSKMLSDVQSLQNERDLENSETRRRLQARVDALESELSTVKRKLDEEIEQAKKASQRREYEHDQNRTRIEDLLKSSSNYKEELVKAQTQRDALQSQVDELKIEVRNAEEKAQALQPRPTTRPEGETDENALTREQELAIEIADLQRDLELKQGELQQAQEEVEQYKSIAQAAEESLQNMNDTHDQYREETDQVLTENDTKIRDLEKRVEEISSELASAHTEVTENRSKAEETTAKLNEEKTRYESELAHLRSESERLETTARMHLEDLKKQAEIAQQAQQNYEDELVKHGNTTDVLRKLREQYNQVKTEVATSKADAESAKASLIQNEETWAENRSRYEQEILELKNRREEVNTQNSRLMKQVEEVSSQISNLKQNRATNEEATRSGTPAGDSDNNMQEIIRYLREEKTITEMQMDLCQRESKRLKGELDHTKAQLEQTREKLEEERQSQIAKVQNATTHTQLMQTINELNLNRESNVTLRNQYESAQKQLNLKIKQVEDLLAQLEPAQTRVREVEHELDSKDGELRLLQEDRDRWQKRTQDIMQKYDRVDPAEIESFKTQISNLEAERDALVAAKQQLESEVEAKIAAAIEERNKFWEERRAKIIEQSKNKVRELNDVIKKLNTQIATANEDQSRISLELSNANEELSKVRNELEQTRVARDQAFEQVNHKASASADAAEEGQVHEGLSEEAKTAYETRIASSEAQASAETEKASKLAQDLQQAQAQVQGLNTQMETLQRFVQAAKDQVTTLQNAPQPPQGGVSSAELEKVKSELEVKQREIDTLKATADAAASIGQAPEDGSKSVAELVQEQVEQISTRLTAEHNQRVSDEEDKYQKRANTMKTQLSKKLAEGKQAIRDEKKAEHDKAIEQLKSEHTAELERLRAEHQEEIQRLKLQGDAIVATTPAEANGTTTETNGTKPAEMTFSPEQIKELLQSNPQVKRIITGNIEKQVKQQKDTWTAQIKQEEEQAWTLKLEEANKAAEEAKVKAVELEGSKMKVKLNMSNNKAATAAAQINHVKKAADDTPQRPVGEVWEEAKTKRPAPAPTAATIPSTTPSVPPPAAAQQQPPQNNAPPTPSPAATVKATPSVNNANAPRNIASDNPFNRSNGPPTGPSHPNPGGFGAPSSFGAPTAVNQQLPTSGFGAPSGVPGGRGTSPFANANQQPPSGPNTNQQQQQSNPSRIPPPVGTGPAALRNLVGQNQNQNQNQHPALNQPLSTGIPQPRGGNNSRGGGRGGYQGRGGGLPQPQQGFGHQQPQDLNVAGVARGGSSLPRGPGNQRGGRGGGRGQVNTQNQQQGQQGGPNSPGGGRGGLNPGARQFNPGGGAGLKRPHEGGDGGNAEKKARGQGE